MQITQDRCSRKFTSIDDAMSERKRKGEAARSGCPSDGGEIVSAAVVKTEPPDFYGKAPLPEAPTEAKPGTAAKMDVMTERAFKKQALFHPQDARLDLS